MKAGDVCRCISDFTGVLPEEITVYKNDIVQIRSVVDRHWLEAEGGGSVGRVPSSVLVKTDLPPCPSHLPLYVAISEFMPSQPGDLGLSRGDFVIGLNPIDDAWWCGQLYGKKGIFPINFVWKINTDLIQPEDSARAVNMKGKVKMSIRAQLPEELDLYAGDIVNITEVIDKDWFRGESNGARGIFPSSFVEVIEESPTLKLPSSAPLQDTKTEFEFPGITLQTTFSSLDYTRPTASWVKEDQASTGGSVSSSVKYNANTGPAYPDLLTGQETSPRSEPPVTLSKTSSYWKTVDASDDVDLFEDDYFKKNMPGLFSASKENNQDHTSSLGDFQATTSSLAGNLNTMNMNIPGCTTAPEGSQQKGLLSDTSVTAASDVSLLNVSLLDVQQQSGSDTKHRYENLESDPILSNRYENIVDTDLLVSVGSEPSAFTQSSDSMLNSISQKVEDYFSKNLLSETEAGEVPKTSNNDDNNNNNNVIKGFNSVSSPGYNEDNTGIEPYGRAIFSFRAQYPNELTFKKGDIIHLHKHVDSHWTFGSVKDAKGIFPTSYVDIIVNCLHNAEELFLARSESTANTSYLGHAKAEYDFQAVQSGDVSMIKGDILKILKFVDDNWVIVENINGSKGMCPKNYLSLLVEGTSEDAQKVSGQLSNQGSDADSERQSRLPLQQSTHSRSRSSSPFNTSVSKRSYKKDDFAIIKKKEVDSEMAKNIASLGITFKTKLTQQDSKNSIFTEREGEDIEADSQPLTRKEVGQSTSLPTVPSRIRSNSQMDGTNTVAALSEVSKPKPLPVSQSSKVTAVPRPLTPRTPPSPLTPPSMADHVRPIVAPRTKLPVVPPRTRISRSPSPTTSNTAVLMDSGSKPGTDSSNTSKDPKLCSLSEIDSVHTYCNTKKPYSVSKRSQQVKRSDNVERGSSLSRGDSSTSNTTFPDDVSSVSANSEGMYSAVADYDSISPVTLPQRPAPPPPPKIHDKFEEETERYYSLPSEEKDAVSLHRTSSVSACLMGSSTGKNAGIHRTSSLSINFLKGKSSSFGKARAPRITEENLLCARGNLRRELVQEMVTTEHEYIHDLEALLQVISLAPSQETAQTVDLEILLGNIREVVDVAKRFLTQLDQIAYEEDETLMVGRVFLLSADDLCHVYKTYCSNHNVAVEPLLKKYAEETGPSAFLQWVLEELRQHKIQLMDMRSVLIKPVQRVLKYPLFLDRLVSETSPGHPDFGDLMEAKARMANVAKEINEHTKRLDLVNKYRFGVDQSLHSKLQSLSMHSVAKKSARLSAIVSEKLGIMSQTKDPEFDEEVAKFRCIQKAAVTMVQDVSVLLRGVRARHKAELDISKGLVAILLKEGRSPEVEAIQRATLDSCNRLLQMFEAFVQQRVSDPARQLVTLCEVPERLILKRYHKMLDYDNAQYKLDRNRDPTRTRITKTSLQLEEELLQVKGTYEALNTQLMMELPVLTKSGLEMLSLSTRSLVAARMYLQGHLAKLYLQLAQVPGLLYTGEEDMLAQFRVKYLTQLGEFRQLSFIPSDTFQRTMPRARPRGRKSIESSSFKRDTPETNKRKVLGNYPPDVIYVVTEVHTPAEVMELTLYPGDHVALLKNKDPLGRPDRWFVDDGDNKGFVKAVSLRPLQSQDNRTTTVPTSSATSSTTITAPGANPAATPAIAPRPSTLPRAAPRPPIPERPPRYEDLFPASGPASRGPPPMAYPSGAQQAPPPRYSPSTVQSSVFSQDPLPSKPGHVSAPSSSALQPQITESEYYSPPLDRQHSNEYNSPVSDASNIYEEIGQGRKDSEATAGADSSPIYEVIEDDDDSPQDSKPSYANTESTLLPEPEFEEPQFYYALYNFGGSDSTQLSLVAGQVVLIIHAESPDWWFVEDRSGNQGYAPASYLTKYS